MYHTASYISFYQKMGLLRIFAANHGFARPCFGGKPGRFSLRPATNSKTSGKVVTTQCRKEHVANLTIAKCASHELSRQETPNSVGGV